MDEDERWSLCQNLGFNNPMQLHKCIQDGAGKNPAWLRSKGLIAKKLIPLGYDLAGMKRLGFSREHLIELGYITPEPETPPPKIEKEKFDKTDSDDVRELINKGYDAVDLRHMGVTVHHCRVAGFEARDLFRRGFRLEELKEEYSLTDLKGVGFNPRELVRYFPGHQMRAAGFTSQEMRCAGFTIRELLNFGYNENQIITAGYSINELLKEGLSRVTKDTTHLRK
jgi:ribosomal protein L13E